MRFSQIGRNPGDRRAAETQMMVIERLWNSVFTVYADPRKESAIALGENVGSNFAIRVASTKRASLLSPLSRYFVQMACIAKREILNASQAEDYEHQVKGPVSWLHFQHMRYVYAKAAQGEINRVAQKCALYRQQVKQREVVEKEIAREKERIEKGESRLGEEGVYFDEFLCEVGAIPSGASDFKDTVSSDPFLGAPDLGSVKPVKSDNNPFVGARDGGRTGSSRGRPTIFGSGKGSVGMAKAPASDGNMGIREGVSEASGGRPSIFGDGKKFAKAPASAGNPGVGAKNRGSAASSVGRPTTFDNGKKFAKKVDVMAKARVSNGNLGIGANASSHAAISQTSTPATKKGYQAVQGRASVAGARRESGSAAKDLGSDPELLREFLHVAQESRGSLTGRESNVAAALAGDDGEHDPSKNCAPQ